MGKKYKFAQAFVVAILFFGLVSAQAVTRTVANGDDDGPGSLRQTIATALPGDTVNFASGISLVNLTSGLRIDKDLTISGPGAKSLTIQRVNTTPTFPIFSLASNVNVTISGMTVTKGDGSLFNDGGIVVNLDATLTIILSNISGNKGGAAGGITNRGGTLNIFDSTISQNSGGGVYNDRHGVLTIRNSTISSNVGSGIDNFGQLYMINSTVSDNSCPSDDGCGLYNESPFTATLISCTIAGNKDDGRRFGDRPSPPSGVLNRGDYLEATNTIFAQNTGGGDFKGTLVSKGYNLIGNGVDTIVTPAQPTDQLGSPSAQIDPMLGPLQDNGGPTFTRALFSGSPARDKGNSSGATTDQRGFTRPVDNPSIPNAAGGDGSDIGAFEIQAGLTARSLNISTRARVQTGVNVLIGGFIVTGNGSKKIIIRAIGPSLKKFALTGLLADPVLELHAADGSLMVLNNDWRDDPSQALQIQNSGFAPSDDLESAIIATLPTAGYTAVVRGNGNSTGLGLVEVYDLDQTGASQLANISSRAFVEGGNNVVIGGFTLGGTNGSPQIIIRAIGPSLKKLGIASPLPNPTLELRDANAALLAFNDDWRDNPAQASQIIGAGAQPQDDLESAIAAALPPGPYTAIVGGKDGATGIGLVEVYNLQ
jgi:hypothetical protein